ncbi:MAG: tetratricopeptide repeat protein [Cyanobacteria bacterium SIG28]|nr:tetratricopeptide repeat protein [Cyanobacteria bacterium SIG28]
MSEQTITPMFTPSCEADKILEEARIAHERYLIKQQDTDLEKAIECYVDVIKTNPSISESYYRLASLLLMKGQISVEGALEQCKTALSLEPNNPNAHIYTGYFQCLSGNFAEAEKEFSLAISRSGKNSARPRLFLSKVLLNRMRGKDSSVKDVMKFLYYFLSGSMMIMWDCPSLKMFYKFLANDFSVFSYKTLGETFEKMKLFPSALEAYSRGLEKTSQGNLFYQKMGDLSLECNDVKSSIACYEKAYELNPSDREVLIKLATMSQTYCPEKVDRTIDYYNSLLEFGIDLDKIYYELGHLYLKKADKIHAVSAFKLAEELNPENPYYNNSLAYAYVKAELYDDAIEYYQRAIKLNPDSEWTSIVCHALGAIYAEIKENYEAAEATFNAGMVLDPNNIDIQLSLGDLFMAQNDLDKAIKVYCDAISVDPLNFLTYAKTGLALWEKDYLEEAIVAFHKSIELNPEFEIAQNNLGVVYLDGIGDPKASLEYFKKAIEINPNYTLAYFNLARAYQAIGDKARAAEYYQMTMDLNKITEELSDKDIRKRLFELFE